MPEFTGKIKRFTDYYEAHANDPVDEFANFPHQDAEGIWIKPMRIEAGKTVYSVKVTDRNGKFLIYRDQSHQQLHTLITRYSPRSEEEGIILDA